MDWVPTSCRWWETCAAARNRPVRAAGNSDLGCRASPWRSEEAAERRPAADDVTPHVLHCAAELLGPPTRGRAGPLVVSNAGERVVARQTPAPHLQRSPTRSLSQAARPPHVPRSSRRTGALGPLTMPAPRPPRAALQSRHALSASQHHPPAHEPATVSVALGRAGPHGRTGPRGDSLRSRSRNTWWPRLGPHCWRCPAATCPSRPGSPTLGPTS